MDILHFLFLGLFLLFFLLALIESSIITDLQAKNTRLQTDKDQLEKELAEERKSIDEALEALGN